MKKVLLFIIAFSSLCFSQIPENFIRGVDVSFTPQIETLGGQYKLNNTITDPLEIFSQNGINYIRLRLWHSPQNGYCGLPSTLDYAKRIKQAGLKLLLDIHYSDTWADPGKQTKPTAWRTLTYNSLMDSVYAYTFYVINSFKNQNTLPDIVQVGNEITPGFLWPEGRVGGTYETQQQWTQFTSLLKNGIKAVNDVEDSIKIMIHIDRGGNNSASRWFFDNLKNYGVNYDIIGLSFYPWWHGTLTALRQNVNDLAFRYGKEIVVAETAYPWTLQWFDNTSNIVGSQNQLHKNYSSSVEGQYSFVFDLFQVVKDIPNNKGLGAIYWAPEYISVQPLGSPWENLALFDFQGNALNSIKVFNEIDQDTSNAINVTFTLNTSTNYDTLKPTGYVQIRGEIVNQPDDLVSGEKISWDINSEVIMLNESGDYWQTTVRVTPGTEINYKYWTGHTKTKPTFLRLGSEGPIQSSFRRFTAGTADTILHIEYYNSTATVLEQYWSPFLKYTDSVGILFRINTADLLKNGTFSPGNGDYIILGGDSVSSSGKLSWDSHLLKLTQEENSVANESFWSGVFYFPRNNINPGTIIDYKFGINKTNKIMWEDQNRDFSFPVRDSTLYWVFFNNRTITDVPEGATSIPESFKLYPAYPNPFNPETTIKYYVPERSFIEISIYDFIGRKIKTLYNNPSEKGTYELKWDSTNDENANISSGVYFIKFSSSNYSTVQKIMLIK